MILKTSRLFVEIVLVALAAVVAFVGVAAWRLSTGPISLDFITPYVVDALNPEDGAFKLEVDSTVLKWERSRRALEIHVVGVTVRDAKADLIAKVPELSVSFSGAALLRGLVAPTRIIIIGPKLKLVRTADGRIRMGLAPFGQLPGEKADRDPAKPEADAIPILVRDLLAPPNPRRRMGYLEEVRIVDASIDIRDQHLGISWRAPDADILLARDVVGLRLEAWLDLQFEGRKARINVVGTYSNADDRIDLAAGFRGLEPAVLAGGSPRLAFLTPFELPISGNVRLAMKGTGEFGDVEITLTGGPGRIVTPQGSVPALDVASLGATIALTEGFSRVRLKDFRMRLVDGPSFKLDGDVKVTGGAAAITASAAVSDLEIAELERYWPADLAPSARGWVMANIHDGVFSEIQAQIVGRADTEGPFKFEVTALDGAMLYENLTVTFLAPMPPVRGLGGSATFDLRGFRFAIARGRLKGLRLGKSVVRLTGLDEEDQAADIRVTLAGPMRDVMTLLDHPRLDYASSLGIVPAKTGGKAIIRARFTMPLLNDLKFDQVRIEVGADIKDMAWRDMLFGRDLTDGQLTVKLDSAGMEVRGAASFYGIPLELRWREYFVPHKGLRRRVSATGIAPADKLADLSFDFTDYAGGQMPLKLEYRLATNGAGTAAFELDLADAAMRMPALDWSKPEGAPGTAKFTVTMQGPAFTGVRGIEFEAEGLVAAGAVGFDAKTGRLVSADVKRLVSGITDFSGTLRIGAGGSYQIDVAGKGLDISGLLKPGNGADKFELPAMTARVRMERLYARPGRYLADANLYAIYDGADWRRISFSGRLAHRTNAGKEGADKEGADKDGALTIELTPFEGKRVLTIESADAGGVIWAFGISDDVVGGKLVITGSIDDTKPKQPLDALVLMTDYKLVKAPVLARLLTVTSLVGIGNLLSGEGIAFSRLEVPLKKNGDLVTVKNARAIGSDLGFTLNGQVDLGKKTVDLGGTIVPAYTLNSLLGYVPFLGRILVGEKGSGVFAASYRIKGPLDDPKISYNPIATLTPGFLRRIFGVPGDGSDKDEDKDGGAKRKRADETKAAEPPAAASRETMPGAPPEASPGASPGASQESGTAD